MEESTLFFEMQPRDVVRYQKIKYTQFQNYISFKLIEENHILFCSKWLIILNKRIYNIQISKIVQYDLKNIICISKQLRKINYGSKFGQNWTKNQPDIQTSNRKLLNKIYWRNFIQNFQEERESRKIRNLKLILVKCLNIRIFSNCFYSRIQN